jgi:hypothetical protein
MYRHLLVYCVLCLVMLINIIQLYHDDDRKIHDYTFKMLIPSNYVTKLIGQSNQYRIFRGVYDQRYHRTLRWRQDQDPLRPSLLEGCEVVHHLH